jgi:hypothetical protein
MSDMSISVTQKEVVLSVLRGVGNGQVEDAAGKRTTGSVMGAFFALVALPRINNLRAVNNGD